jgi:hypothetical protein
MLSITLVLFALIMLYSASAGLLGTYTSTKQDLANCEGQQGCGKGCCYTSVTIKPESSVSLPYYGDFVFDQSTIARCGGTGKEIAISLGVQSVAGATTVLNGSLVNQYAQLAISSDNGGMTMHIQVANCQQFLTTHTSGAMLIHTSLFLLAILALISCVHGMIQIFEL